VTHNTPDVLEDDCDYCACNTAVCAVHGGAWPDELADDCDYCDSLAGEPCAPGCPQLGPGIPDDLDDQEA